MANDKKGGTQKNYLLPRDLFQLKINKEIILLFLQYSSALSEN